MITTTSLSKSADQVATSRSAQVATTESAPKMDPPNPTLQEVVSLIRTDASENAMMYLMRSNTGHDGE